MLALIVLLMVWAKSTTGVATWYILAVVFALVLAMLETIRDSELMRVVNLGRQWQHLSEGDRSVHVGSGAFSLPFNVAIIFTRIGHFIILLGSIAETSDTVVTILLILAVVDSVVSTAIGGARIAAIQSEQEGIYLNAAASADYRMFSVAPGQPSRPYVEFIFSPPPAVLSAAKGQRGKDSVLL